MGTNNVQTVCQVERGGGKKERGGFGEKNNIRTKKQCKTDRQMEAREEGRT